MAARPIPDEEAAELAAAFADATPDIRRASVAMLRAVAGALLAYPAPNMVVAVALVATQESVLAVAGAIEAAAAAGEPDA